MIFKEIYLHLLPSFSRKQSPLWSSWVSRTTLSEFHRDNQIRVSPWWPQAGTKSGKFEKSTTRPVGNSFQSPSMSLKAFTLKALLLNFWTKLGTFKSFRSLPTVMRREPEEKLKNSLLPIMLFFDSSLCHIRWVKIFYPYQSSNEGQLRW